MINDALLSDLRIFISVARNSSFVGAATETGTSPAHISKRVGILEASLGVKLFYRTTRRVVITQDGELVYERTRKLLDDLDAMGDELANNKGEPSGTLRISTSLRLGRNHVSHVLSLLQAEYPKLEIWLELLDRGVDLIDEGFDIDIRVGEPVQQQLIAHRITEGSRVLCASPRYIRARGQPRTLADLAQHECLVFRDREQGFGVWRLQGPKGLESVKVRGRFGSNHSDVVRNWALDGHGIILLSVWDIAAEVDCGNLVRVLPSYSEPAHVWAMTSTRSSSSAKVDACVNFLKRHLTEGPFRLTKELGS